jgi:O-antigen/teichoic acid export membrane protein
MPAPKAVLASHNRFDRSSQIDATRRLVETAGLLLVLATTGAGLAGWAVVCIVSDMVCTALLWRAAAKTHLGLGVGVSMVRLSSIRDLFSLGTQITVLQLSGQLSVNADPFILAACLGPASVALYRPPSQVVAAVSPLVFTLANQLHPLATKAHVAGNNRDLTTILFRGTKYTMLLGSVFCAIVISLAHPLCKLWLGKALGAQYTICAAILTLQAVTQFGAFAAGTQWPVLLGMNRTAFAAYGRLALAVLNVTTSWVLVQHTGLGVLGVVIPTMVIEFIWRPMLAYYVCRAVDTPAREYASKAYIWPSLIGIAVAIMGLVVCWLAPPENVWHLATAAVTLALIGTTLIWFIGLSRADRIQLQKVVESFV